MTISMMAMYFDDFNGSDSFDEFDNGDTNDECGESEVFESECFFFSPVVTRFGKEALFPSSTPR